MRQQQAQSTDANAPTSNNNVDTEKLRAKRAAKKRRKKAKAALNTQSVQEENPSTSCALELQIPQQEAIQSLEDAKRAKEELKAARKLQQIEEKLARLAVQQEQQETIPQNLTKAQRRKLNKERDLERFAQAQIIPARPEKLSEEPSAESLIIPCAQELVEKNPEELIWEVPLRATAQKIIPVEIDGSYVREKTSKSIVIAGPYGTTITLRKKIHPAQITPPSSYAPDIQKWRNNPKAMLEEREEIKPSLKDPIQRNKVIAHAFAKAVDNFIASHASTCTIFTNKDMPETAICLPGKIRYADGNEEEGFFGYLVDVDNRCFHRMFERGFKSSSLARQLKKNGCFDDYHRKY
jgi:hypothetical protein